MVCLDAMGVIFESRDDVAELLVPFARSRGSQLSDREIEEQYRLCSLGRFTSADLWRVLDVSGDVKALDASHLRAHRLMPGLREFVERCTAQGLAVACVSNDVSEWARWLRIAHGLDGRIEPWIASGDVGVRKPDEAIYRELLDRTGVAAADCLYVDDRPANIDAALRLGFTTVVYGGSSAIGGTARDLVDLGRTVQMWLS